MVVLLTSVSRGVSLTSEKNSTTDGLVIIGDISPSQGYAQAAAKSRCRAGTGLGGLQVSVLSSEKCLLWPIAASSQLQAWVDSDHS